MVVTMGSVIGTIKSVLADMRQDGTSIGALTIRSYRPFPKQQLRDALAAAKTRDRIREKPCGRHRRHSRCGCAYGAYQPVDPGLLGYRRASAEGPITPRQPAGVCWTRV